MKVFITVGTTPFDELIRSVDSIAPNFVDWSFTYQISEGSYTPKSGIYFKFVENIDDFYKDSDVVITHAGAGSIYRLLELNKKIVVAPNLVRVDKHQSDIANYMGKNGHVLLLSDLNNSLDIMESIEEFSPKPYVKERFFVKDELVGFIMDAIN